jgi:serine O-acetyltransferase
MSSFHKFKNFIAEVNSDVDFLRGQSSTLKTRISTFMFFPGYRAVFIYRVQKLVKSLNLDRLELLISNFNQFLTGAEICSGADIGAPFTIRHPSGVVIGGGATIGKRVTVLQGITIGQANVLEDFDNSGPIVGDDVILGANSSILGSIFVANGTKIGAHSLVLESTVENGTYIGVPAKIVSGTKTDE